MSSAVISSAVHAPWPPLRPFLPLGPSPQPGRILELPRGVVPGSRLEVRPAPATAPSGIAELDALIGGLPRGALSEIFGPVSSGRTSLILAVLAAATRRQEVCALVDAGDSLHPQYAATAGVDLQRLLWIRCGPASSPRIHAEERGAESIHQSSTINRQSARNSKLETRNSAGHWPLITDHCFSNRQSSIWDHRLAQVLKTTDLLLQSGGFGMVVVDLADVPPRWARRIPLASWFRFRRAVENTPTVLLVVEQEPYAKTCASLVLKMQPSVLSIQHSVHEEPFQKLPGEAARKPAQPLIVSCHLPAHAHILRALPVRAEVVHDRFQRKPVRSAVAQFAARANWTSPLAG